MKVIISGHHTDTGDALRVYVEEHLLKIEKYFETEVQPKVIFEKDHNMFTAEIMIHDTKGKHIDFFAKSEHSDIHGAFDSALAKLEHQLRKYHDKVKHSFKKKMRAHEKEIDIALSPSAEE